MALCAAMRARSYPGGNGRRPILTAVRLVKGHRTRQTLTQVDPRSPLQHPPDLAIVDVNRANVDRLALGRERNQAIAARTGDLDEQVGQFSQAHRLDRSD